MFSVLEKTQLLQTISDIDYTTFLELLCMEIREGFVNGTFSDENNQDVDQRVTEILEIIAPKYDKSLDVVIKDFDEITSYYQDMITALHLREINGLH